MTTTRPRRGVPPLPAGLLPGSPVTPTPIPVSTPVPAARSAAPADSRPAPDFVPSELVPEQTTTLAAAITRVFGDAGDELLSVVDVVDAVEHLGFDYATAFPQAKPPRPDARGEDYRHRHTRKWLATLVERGVVVTADTYEGMDFWQAAPPGDKPGDTEPAEPGTHAGQTAEATAGRRGELDTHPGRSAASAFAVVRRRQQQAIDRAATGKAEQRAKYPYPDWQIWAIWVVAIAVVMLVVSGALN